MGILLGVGCVCVLDTRFAVIGGVNIVSHRAYLLVSLIERRPLRSRRLQLTSAESPARYRLFTPG